VLKTVRALDRLYFYVPKGAKQFSVHVQASVRGEGLAYEIRDPDGNICSEGEGDFDRCQKVEVKVPPNSDGRAWSLSILKPKAKRIGLDDTEIYLGDGLAPYLAAKAEWAVDFGRRKHP
jgi:hypothetical protein